MIRLVAPVPVPPSGAPDALHYCTSYHISPCQGRFSGASGNCCPHNVRPWLLHDHGFVVAVVFASSLQDALDVATEDGHLDRYTVDLTDASVREDYLTPDFSEAEAGLDRECAEWTAPDGTPYWWRKDRQPAMLGNASEPFDISTLDYLEMPNPAWSFCSLFNAR